MIIDYTTCIFVGKINFLGPAEEINQLKNSRWMAKIQNKIKEEKNAKGEMYVQDLPFKNHTSKWGPLLCHVRNEINFRFEMLFKEKVGPC